MAGIERAHVQRASHGLELGMIDDSKHIAVDAVECEGQTNRYRDTVTGSGERGCYGCGTGNGINAGTPFRNDSNAVSRNQLSFVCWQACLSRIAIDSRIQAGVDAILGIHAGRAARERTRSAGTDGSRAG